MGDDKQEFPREIQEAAEKFEPASVSQKRPDFLGHIKGIRITKTWVCCGYFKDNGECCGVRIKVEEKTDG